MVELIPITDYQGNKAVNARSLHQFLESKREFATWMKDRIKKYGLIENQDYVCLTNLSSEGRGGQNKIEYALTIDCAKELAMVEGNAKGKQDYVVFDEFVNNSKGYWGVPISINSKI